MSYICKKHFIALNGEVFYYGQRIDEIRYAYMKYDERKNFEQEFEQIKSSDEQQFNPFRDEDYKSDISSPIPDYDNSNSTDSGSSFDGFGGGDTGGGGASGDY